MPRKKHTQTLPARGPVDVRWFDDQLEQAGLTRTTLAARWGGHANLVGRLLRGDKQLDATEALAVAAALNVPVTEIIRRMGYECPRPVAPVVGELRPDGQVLLRAGARETVLAPEDAGAGLVAVDVAVTIESLSLYPRSFLFYRPSDRIEPSAIGRVCIIEANDCPLPLVGKLDPALAGESVVRIFGGPQVVRTRELTSATPLLWIKSG